MDLFSVVIPLYNKRPYIKRAVESILAQTIQNFEIIVVDDGSTDGGADIVREIDSPKIRLFQQENFGVSAARNCGITRAQGDIVAFLDADDEWKPGFLKKIAFLAEKYPHAGAYATAVESIEVDGSLKVKNFRILDGNLEDGVIENYFKVASQFPLTSSSIAVPKIILSEVGGFRLFEELSEDVDMWVRIALRYPIAWSEDSLVVLHKEAGNRAVVKKRFHGEPIVSRTIRHAIRGGFVSRDHLCDASEFAALFQIYAARSNLIEGKRKDALLLLEHAKGTKKFSQMWLILKIFSSLPFDIGSKLWRFFDLGGGRKTKELLKKILGKN